MKRYILLPVVCALAAAAAAWGVVRWNAAGCGGCGPADAPLDAARLVSALGLSPEQATSVRQACADYAAELARCRAAHGSARCALSCRIFDTNAAPAGLDAAAEALCRAQLAAEKVTVEHFRRVHALLTPEQQARYERLVRTCVCGGAGGQPCEACCTKGAP